MPHTFGQHQESQPLTGPDFLSVCKVLVWYSQPIKFVTFDGKSELWTFSNTPAQISGFLVLTKWSSQG